MYLFHFWVETVRIMTFTKDGQILAMSHGSPVTRDYGAQLNPIPKF